MLINLLMITWNRKPYVVRSVAQLLGQSASFRLHIWDNGSTDGTAEYVASLEDERIVRLHLHKSNVMQAVPTYWFLDDVSGGLIGKVDDDTLVPDGWIDALGAAVSQEPSLGMIGCWTFYPEDFLRNEDLAKRKVVDVGGHLILHNSWIGGTAFLMRAELAKTYLDRGNGTQFPMDRWRMTLDGYVSGWMFPLLHADHMDDPRSEHCLYDEDGAPLALTAKLRGLNTPEQFLSWIKQDADQILQTSTQHQISQYRRGQRRARLARLKNSLRPRVTR